MERDLDSELRFHMEQQAADHERAGMTEQEAQRTARLEFGGLQQIKEDCRESRGTIWVASVLQDLRIALRQLRKSPGFAITAVLTLALGIGANTSIFTLVQSILLRSLPVADPSHLYRIGDRNDCCYYDGFENEDGDFDLFSYDLYLHFKQSAAEFEELAAVEAGGANFSVRSGSVPAKPLRAEYVSGNYFDTLGVGAFAGRPLHEDDDQPGAAPAVVLSYQAWQTDFAGDPGIVGSTMYVETHPFTVAGVAPPGFFGDRVIPFPPDLWMPLASEPLIEGANSSLLQKDTDWLYALGRVRPGVNTIALQTKLSAALRQWMHTRPTYTEHGRAALIPRQHVVLAPAGGGIQRLQQHAQTGTGLRMLMLLSSVVLLTACANIANLLLARSSVQRADVAMRMALGAGHGRIMRQVLTESLLLSLIGGAAGVMVAYIGSHMILALAFPLSRNMPIHASPSMPVLGFALAVSLLTGVVFGAAPAWTSSRAQPAETLRGINTSTRDRSSLPQQSLIVFQVAMSVVLLAGALLMGRSLYYLEHQELGISTANRFVVQFNPRGAGYTVDRLPALYRQIEDRFSALPFMIDMSLARYLPLSGGEWGACVIPQGHPAPGPNDKCFADWDRVSNGFLSSIGVPIVRGRGFTAQDTSSSPLVVLVNHAFARRFFPNQNPIGLRFGTDSPQYSSAFEIVGVFADFKMTDPRKEAGPLFLRPLTQQFTGFKDPDLDAAEKNFMYMRSMIFHFSRPQQDAEAVIRNTLADIDPNLTISRFGSYDSEVAGNFSQDRLMARLTGIFGMLSLVLASIGLYGVTSYLVARRRGEIGIRMALGATRSRVVTMVLRTALLQVLMGLALGIPAALLTGHLMNRLLYQVSANDPLVLLGTTIVLGICATVAGFIPARRAASIDPMRALRSE
jgi:predicted permease